MRELPSVRRDLVQLGEVQPLEREILAHRPGPRIGKHPLYLGSQHVGFAETRFGGELQEFFIRQAAPQKEGEPRRQLQIGERANRTRADSGLGPIEEMRARQDGAEHITHAAFEASRRGSRVVERHQRIEILGGHRATERAPREVLDDLLRARRFFAWRRRLAHENLRSAGRPARAGDGKRAANLQGMRRLDALLTAFQRDRAGALVALGEAAMDEGDRQLVLPCRGLEPDLPQPPVDLFDRGVQPLSIALWSASPPRVVR